MRFGRTATEEAERPSATGGRWIRYLKAGDTTFRIIEDSADWLYFDEHFNPGGRSFPCTGDKSTCPGCTSEVEKMQKPGTKAAFHVREGEYINVYKLDWGPMELLKNREERLGTLTDRDYTISKFKMPNGRNGYDIEGSNRGELKLTEKEQEDVASLNIEDMLAESFEEAWGDQAKANATNKQAKDAAEGNDLKGKLARQDAEQSEDPPSEPKADAKAEGDDEVDEQKLREMDKIGLLAFIETQGMSTRKYEKIKTVDQIVDQLIEDLA